MASEEETVTHVHVAKIDSTLGTIEEAISDMDCFNRRTFVPVMESIADAIGNIEIPDGFDFGYIEDELHLIRRAIERASLGKTPGLLTIRDTTLAAMGPSAGASLLDEIRALAVSVYPSNGKTIDFHAIVNRQKRTVSICSSGREISKPKVIDKDLWKVVEKAWLNSSIYLDGNQGPERSKCFEWVFAFLVMRQFVLQYIPGSQGGTTFVLGKGDVPY